MSLQPQLVPGIPRQTVRVARAAFPQGNRYMLLRDELGTIYDDQLFADLFPKRGQPAQAPWQLALVTLMQFMENLSDRQAADAVRSRIDWKYVLSLELTDAGFDFSLLSEFRQRLLAGNAEELLLNRLLECCQQQQWLKAQGKQRTDATHVLARIRAMNRLECVIETMRHALNSLALLVPDWLSSQAPSDWVARYGHRAEDFRLPKTIDERIKYAQQVGQDGYTLLECLDSFSEPALLWQLPAVDTLRRVWLQQFQLIDSQALWRTEKDGSLPPSARFISSPYDLQAHYSRKNTTSWVGYKVHLTETCEDDQPHLITQVVTTSGTSSDLSALPVIHQALQHKGLVPTIHLVDTGYIDATSLVDSQEHYKIDLLGPARMDVKWQAQAGEGFAAADFKLNWTTKQAICPQGQLSKSWSETIEKGHDRVVIKFSQKQCMPCAFRSKCTQGKRRTIHQRSGEYYQALVKARERERSGDYQTMYNRRAGIEGTLSQGVRAFGLRRSRYIGLPKTHLQHVLTAAAINLCRLDDWLSERPRATTRQSTFARLMTK